MATDEDIQQEPDLRIRRPEPKLRGLKLRRNNLSPVSRLPPEILCQIFLLSIPDFDNIRNSVPAMSLSHVSHTWRDVALAYPELWGILHVAVDTSGEVLRLAYERAQQAPLRINMWGFHRDDVPEVPSEGAVSALTEIIREGSTRCVELDLYMCRDSFDPPFSGFSGSFDRLAILKLDIASLNTMYYDLGVFSRCSFPQLRRLTIKRPAIPLDCKLLQSTHLTHIHINSVKAKPSTMMDMLALFKRSAGLREFYVGGFGRLPTFEYPKVDNVVCMSRMQKFGCSLALRWLWDTDAVHCFEFVTRLLSSISLPASAMLHVDWAADRVDTTLLMHSVVSAYGHVAPIALAMGAHDLKVWGPSSLDAITREVTLKKADWIAVQHGRNNTCPFQIWEWGWSFSNLRVLEVDEIYGMQGDTEAEQMAKTFWEYFAESAISLEVIHITGSISWLAGIDELLRCLRGENGSWPALRRLHTTLPPNSESYQRRRQDAVTPLLDWQVEYALDLVDSLKAREKSGLQRLALLRFAKPFHELWGKDIGSILRDGATKVEARFYPLIRRDLSRSHPDWDMAPN